VLGVDWLVTHGDIPSNFDKLSMQFFVQGKKLVLRGQQVRDLRQPGKK